MTLDGLVKLARAVDQWSGSIAVYQKRDDIVAWGVLDQLVGQSVRLHRESASGFRNPGILTVTMDGVARISAYHGDMFLGSINAQEVVTRENDALSSDMVLNYGFDAFEEYAEAIAGVLRDDDVPTFMVELVRAWTSNLARLCIGLRRNTCGGAFLLTPRPMRRRLNVGHKFMYDRLSRATILNVLDSNYKSKLEEACIKLSVKRTVPYETFAEQSLAETDFEDRLSEVTGAVKLVTSLGTLDGLVLFTPTLSVSGFGVKIGGGPNPTKVFDGADFSRRGKRATTIDVTRFGTRHGSMLRYCFQDKRALGLVVSQDGQVRLIMTEGDNLVMWDDLKLLGHHDYSKAVARRWKRRRASRRRARHLERIELGFTGTPKTVAALLHAGRGDRTRASPRSK